MKDLARMSPTELIAEANSLRGNISDKASRLGEVYRVLYANVRRNPDDMTSTYMLVSNAGVRTAGMIVQGLRRSEQTHKVLEQKAERAREEAEEQARRAAAKEARDRKLAELEARRRQEAPSTEEALDDLYGEEII